MSKPTLNQLLETSRQLQLRSTELWANPPAMYEARLDHWLAQVQANQRQLIENTIRLSAAAHRNSRRAHTHATLAILTSTLALAIAIYLRYFAS